jgi:hypothetical protein
LFLIAFSILWIMDVYFCCLFYWTIILKVYLSCIVLSYMP